jgi:hypothetical protein
VAFEIRLSLKPDAINCLSVDEKLLSRHNGGLGFLGQLGVGASATYSSSPSKLIALTAIEIRA